MRTSRQTLPYWQFDVGLLNDPKIVDLVHEKGPLGFSIFCCIRSLMTSTDGYFIPLNDALIITIYRTIGSKWIKDRDIIYKVIYYCGECGLFDVNLLSQNIITSRGIQRRWLDAKKKSRARGFSTSKFWILEDEEEPELDNCTQNFDNCNNKDDYCSNKAENCSNKDNINISEVEGKVTVSKSECEELTPTLKNKYGKYNRVELTETEYQALHSKYSNADELIAFLDSYIEEKGSYNSKSHYIAIERWVVKAVSERKEKGGAKKTGFNNYSDGSSISDFEKMMLQKRVNNKE